MQNQNENVVAVEDNVRFWLPLLALADVGLLFIGLFVANAAAWWIWLSFHIALFGLTIFVLKLACSAARCVPESIPHQRKIGSLLYISCQCIVFFGVGQLPLALAGYIVAAGPIGFWFLFDHLPDE